MATTESQSINAGAADGNDAVKVSSNDTTASFLESKLVAGSNITLSTNNDGGNETITIASAGGVDTDEKTKVSANDSTAGYLNGKLVAGTGVTLTEGSDGGNETLTIASTVTDQLVKARSTDTTANYLALKLSEGAGIGFNILNSGSNEQIQIISAQNVKVSSNDTTGGFLNGKIVAGSGITLTEGSDGGNETLTIEASGGGGGSSDITYYTASLSDCENTIIETNLIEATIPANTWADGEQVWLNIAGDLASNGSQGLTVGIGGTGIGPYTRSANVVVDPSDPNRFQAKFRFMRNGSGLYYYVGAAGSWGESIYLDIGISTILIGAFGRINAVSYDWMVFDSSVDFTTDITLALTAQWTNANPSNFIRPFWGNAYKEKGTAL